MSAHFGVASHMQQTGCGSVSRMNICSAWGAISLIITAFSSFKFKAVGEL